MISIILMSITYNIFQVLGVTSRRLPGRGLGSKSNLNQRGIGNFKATDVGEESLSSQPMKVCRPSVASNIVVRIIILCLPAAIRSAEDFPKRFKPKPLGWLEIWSNVPEDFVSCNR